MRSRRLTDTAPRSHMLVFRNGDEVLQELRRFARSQAVPSAYFRAIGAFAEADLAFFSWAEKRYQRIPLREQAEVLALIGDLTLVDGEPKVHAHVVLGLHDGTTCGGHLLSGTVRPTVEMVLTETATPLRRTHDDESGLALIDLTQPGR